MKKMPSLIADELIPSRNGHIGRLAEDKIWLVSHENKDALYKLEGLYADIYNRINGEKSFLVIYLEVQQDYEVTKDFVFGIFEDFEIAGIIYIKENSP